MPPRIRPTHVIGTGLAIVVGTLGLRAATSSSPSTTPPPVPAHHSAGVPGALDPHATKEKVCTKDYTATIRPPASYTTALKLQQLKARGYPDQNPADYEEDHFISLELGGDPRSPNNLYPELWSEAHKKDQEENALHAAVCQGKLTLLQAQHQILQDWE